MISCEISGLYQFSYPINNVVACILVRTAVIYSGTKAICKLLFSSLDIGTSSAYVSLGANVKYVFFHQTLPQ